MKQSPQPIIFTPVDACVDNNSDYCQTLHLLDDPKFRLSRLCDEELLGTTVKQPCEYFTVLSDLSAEFITLDGMIADDTSVGSDGLAGTHTATTASGFLQANTAYSISYFIKGLTFGNGTFKIKAGDNYGPTRGADGYYTDTIHTGTGTDLQLVGIDTGELIFDGIFSNIVIQCIRYSSIFTLTVPFGTVDGTFSFNGQTKICVIPGSGTGGNILKNVTCVPGKTYKLSFHIIGNTAPPLTGGSSNVGYSLWPSSAPLIGLSGSNGYYELYVTAGDGSGGGAPGSAEHMEISVSDLFTGCIEDITLYAVADLRIGAFNEDGTENTCVELTTYGEDDGLYDSEVVKISASSDDACGCFKIGYADSCEDYHGQFSGNSLLNIITPSETIRLTPSELVNIDSSGVFDIVGGEAQESSITYSDIIDPGYKYCGSIKVKADEDIEYFITVIIGGVSHSLGSHTVTAGVYYEFDYSDLLSGSINTDIKFIITCDASFPGTGTVEISTIDVHLCSGQLIPRYWSNCFNMVPDVDCDDTLLIKYSNSKPLFGLIYDSNIPYYSFRINAKIWHSKLSKTRELNRGSLGHETINYSDIRKIFTMNTEPLPDYLIDALAVALDHDTLEIGNNFANLISYVSQTDEVNPLWNKKSNLAPVEITLAVQDKRVVKSYC